MHHIPEMPIEILEIPAISSIKCFRGSLRDSRSGTLGECDDAVYLLFTLDIVSESESRVRWSRDGESGVVGDTCLWPKGETESILEVEKCDRTILELFSDDPIRRETETITIESYGLLEILDREGDDSDFGFHESDLKIIS